MMRWLTKVCMIKLMAYTAPVKKELKFVSSRSLGYCSFTSSWNEYWPRMNIIIEMSRNDDSRMMYLSFASFSRRVSRLTVIPNSRGSFLERVNEVAMNNSNIDTIAILMAQTRR